jgi:tetratricopeptide (TPR) repeat protein
LSGDRAGAIEAMRLAGSAAIGRREPTAWVQVQLGKLEWNRGRLAAAATHYRAALQVFPGYVNALDALAQVEAASGNLRRAIALEQRAVASIPLPQFVGLLGDLQRAAGHATAARRSYALVGVIDRLLRAGGVRTDLEIALFRADHGVALRQTLALARRAQHERPSIDGDDVLAWTLERNGRCADALTYSRRALRLGTQDALKFFHRGMIERCLGDRAEARTWFRQALALNPHFSVVWAPSARRYAS